MSKPSLLRLISTELFSSGRRFRSSVGNLIYLDKSDKTDLSQVQSFAVIVRNATSSVERHREKRVWREIWRHQDKSKLPVGMYVLVTSKSQLTFAQKNTEFTKLLEKIK